MEDDAWRVPGKWGRPAGDDCESERQIKGDDLECGQGISFGQIGGRSVVVLGGEVKNWNHR